MMMNMDNMGLMMGGMALVWILVGVFIVLGIFAFIKYIRRK